MAAGTHSSSVNQLKDITVVYDCSVAAATLIIYSDFNSFSVQGSSVSEGGGLNGATVPTVTANLPVTVGRGSITIPLDAVGGGPNYLEGTIFKFEVTCPATAIVRLFSATVRHRKVGVYLQASQSWRTQEISLN